MKCTCSLSMMLALLLLVVTGVSGQAAVPVIELVRASRGPAITPDGISWHESILVHVADADGFSDIASITITDTDGVPHATTPGGGVAWEWTQLDANTAEVRWWGAGGPVQAPAGSYTVSAVDEEANSDVLVTPHVPLAPETAPAITFPANGAFIEEVAPTFTWDSYPGATMYSIYLSSALDGEEVWYVMGTIPGDWELAAYNYDGAALYDSLSPGTLYSFFLDCEVLVDYFVSDPRVMIAFYPSRTVQFEVAPSAMASKAKVVFTGCSQGQPFGPGLFVSDGDFSDPVRLTWRIPEEAALPECYCPGCDIGAVSPDATRIAMSRNGRLAMLELAALMYHPAQTPEWLLDESGEQIRGWSPTWSPDGSQLAYDGGFGEDPGLHIVNADGTGQQLVVGAVDGSFGDQRWSPDGTRIVFRQGESNHYNAHLWVVENLNDPGDPTARQLTDDSRYIEEGPVWSPDGSRVLFSRGLRFEFMGGAGADLWVIDVASGVKYQLTETSDTREGAIGWSPFDGYIYFSEWHAAGEPGYEAPFTSRICRICPDGSGYEVINDDPRVSPWGCTWVQSAAWIDGLHALAGETIAPRLGVADAVNLAGVQAKVGYTGCCNILSLDDVGLGESLLDWVMPAPSITANTATFLAYAGDPGTEARSGLLQLFDLGITNDPSAMPGDTQLLFLDELLLSDDWGNPLECTVLSGGVRTIPFASLEVATVTGPVCADANYPVSFPVTITAHDWEGAFLSDCSVTVDLAQYDSAYDEHDWAAGPLVPPATGSQVTLVDGAWTGKVAITRPLPETCLHAAWDDFGGVSDTFQAIGLGDVNADDSISIFDVIKIANIAIGRGTWEDWQWWAANLNGDEEVNIYDVIICADRALGEMGTTAAGRTALLPAGEVTVSTDLAWTESEALFTVYLSDCTGVAGAQVELEYDAKKLRYIGVAAGELLQGSSWSVLDNDLDGKVRAIAYTPTRTVLTGGQGSLLEFQFARIANGKGKVELTKVDLSTAAGLPIACTEGKTNHKP